MPQTFPTRIEMLARILPVNPAVCEVGVFRGGFAQEMLSTLDPKILILIDPFDGQMISGDVDGNNVEGADLPTVYLKMAEATRFEPRIVLLRARSEEMLPKLRSESLDCVYIDGDHSYEGVRRDLEEAWRLVKPGGFVCGHDYDVNLAKTSNTYDFGVKRAVDEFCVSKGVEIYAKGMDGHVSFAIKRQMADTISKEE